MITYSGEQYVQYFWSALTELGRCSMLTEQLDRMAPKMAAVERYATMHDGSTT